MKGKNFGLFALLTSGALLLSGCGDPTNPDEGVQLANPAAIYCEDNGGILIPQNNEDGEYALCELPDGTVCEEWAYFRDECQPREIIYNTISTKENPITSKLYSEEDLADAETAITNKINEWEIATESLNIFYAGDEVSTDEFEYCQSLKADITGCAIFISSFHIPEQDIEITGAFEPNSDIYGYSWYLGRSSSDEWEVLTNGF